MSVTREKNSKKFKLVHSNLYQIHGSQEPTPVAPTKKQVSTAVLKTEDLNQKELSSILVKKYEAMDLQTKKPAAPARPPYRPETSNLALVELRRNLQILNDLHTRLRFMLEELEQIVEG